MDHSPIDWTKPEITKKICELAAKEANVSASDVSAETHLVNDLNYDSLMEIELVMKLEDAFHINLPETELNSKTKMPKCVSEYVDAVESRLRDEPPGGDEGI